MLRLPYLSDEDRQKETHRRQAAKLARHHHAPPRGELLGYVEALNRERAEAVAIKLFALDDDQRRRLLIRERF